MYNACNTYICNNPACKNMLCEYISNIMSGEKILFNYYDVKINQPLLKSFNLNDYVSVPFKSSKSGSSPNLVTQLNANPINQVYGIDNLSIFKKYEGVLDLSGDIFPSYDAELVITHRQIGDSTKVAYTCMLLKTDTNSSSTQIDTIITKSINEDAAPLNVTINLNSLLKEQKQAVVDRNGASFVFLDPIIISTDLSKVKVEAPLSINHLITVDSNKKVDVEMIKVNEEVSGDTGKEGFRGNYITCEPINDSGAVNKEVAVVTPVKGSIMGQHAKLQTMTDVFNFLLFGLSGIILAGLIGGLFKTVIYDKSQEVGPNYMKLMSYFMTITPSIVGIIWIISGVFSKMTTLYFFGTLFLVTSVIAAACILYLQYNDTAIRNVMTSASFDVTPLLKVIVSGPTITALVIVLLVTGLVIGLLFKKNKGGLITSFYATEIFLVLLVFLLNYKETPTP